jgi:hypothetical protein
VVSAAPRRTRALSELRGRDSTGNQFPGPAEPLAKEATIYVAEPFPRNLALVSVLYIGERPEMIFSQREVTEGQNRKEN